MLHGAEQLLVWLGWLSCGVGAARRSARSMRLRGGGLTFRPGGGSGCWYGRCGLRAVCPVQLGLRVARLCGVEARARAVVSRDGGPGRWCFRFGVHCDLVSCGWWGYLDDGRQRYVAQLFWSVGFFIFVGASHVCSSHSTHGVFYLALVGGRPVLVKWCCLGFIPILACFSLINRTTYFFLN
jgi:hypothetical protein